MKQAQFATLTLDTIVGGGQALGTLDDGRKAFVWGGLPGETVSIRITKKKSHFVEGIVTEVLTASPERIAPLDPASYLSTSPWQIMSFDAEQHYKAALIEEAFELHDIVLPNPIQVYSDGITAHYRNKVEFSWYSVAGEESESFVLAKHLQPKPSADAYSTEAWREAVSAGQEVSDSHHTYEIAETLDLAFFRRGSKGKIVIDECSLLPEAIMTLARAIRDLLRAHHVTARQLKTLLIRCDQQGRCVWQLYVKDETFDHISEEEARALPAMGGEIIYSDPRSPASRITTRLASFGDIVLSDTLLGVPFRYATEGFFQVNVPVYEQALNDMAAWLGDESPVSGKHLQPEKSNDAYSKDFPREAVSSIHEASYTYTHKVLDLYSGVGTIGLTIGGTQCTLVEIDEHAVREMKRNITALGSHARAILAPTEKALEYITSDMIVVIDPPRAGMHQDVIARLLEMKPPRIIYLSCNPVTQARDIARLAPSYGIRWHQGYNFFPRTPHIEHCIVLDCKA